MRNNGGEWTCPNCHGVNAGRFCENCGLEPVVRATEQATIRMSPHQHQPGDRLCDDHGRPLRMCEPCLEASRLAMGEFRTAMDKLRIRMLLTSASSGNAEPGSRDHEPHAESPRSWCAHQPGTFLRRVNQADAIWSCTLCGREFALVDEEKRWTTPVVKQRRRRRAS
jgi:hypothetical protein